MKKISFIIIVTITLSSCVNSVYRDDLQSGVVSLSDFPQQKISCDTIAEVIIKQHADINLIDSFLFNNTYTNTDGIVQVHDLNGKQITTFGKRGKGPEELIYGLNADINFSKQLYYLYDMNLRKIIEYKYNTGDSLTVSVNKIYHIKQNQGLINVLDNSRYISTIYKKEGLMGIFSFNSDKPEAYLGSYPVNINVVNNLSRRLQGSFAINKGNNKIIFVSFHFGYIACYDLNSLKTQWELLLTKPYIKLEQGKIYFNKKNHKEGFNSIKTINNNIYTLYKDKTEYELRNWREHPGHNKILVFNINGKPIKEYILDKKIISFTINKQEDVIYAIGIHNQRYYILRFNL